jgi:predicted AAA+ superfamily ATPase
MIDREAQAEILTLMHEFPAVGILGPRQVGKTTLAEDIAATLNPKPIYLDLENPSDQSKLRDPEGFELLLHHSDIQYITVIKFLTHRNTHHCPNTD